MSADATARPGTPPAPRPTAPEVGLDALTVGRRVRHLRTARGMTLEQLAAAVGRAPSQVSVLENGKREPKLSLLQAVAAALGCPLGELLQEAPPSHRDALEITLERHQRGAVFAGLGLPEVRVGRGLPTDVLELVVGLQEEVLRLHAERSATPEEARRANAELRAQWRARDNHEPDLERRAADLLTAVGHTGGPLSQGRCAALAAHLGFSLHYVGDLPPTTRSITDLEHGRIYLPSARSRAAGGSGDPRTTLLQALASTVLGHGEPRSYAQLLRQRVESNYLSAALLMPQESAVAFLRRAKADRELSVEDLRDAFAVPYETAAHRFSNLATVHLDLPVHFMKVDRAGRILKAYENDGVRFPTDALGAVEGQPVCRHWTVRTVFDIADQLSPYHQYTDTAAGTFWCTARTQPGSGTAGEGLDHSVALGVPYAHVRWFRGRATTERATSRCPEPACCRQSAPDVARRWEGRSWASPRTPSSLLASTPVGSFGGVDTPAVHGFLEAHAPRA